MDMAHDGVKGSRQEEEKEEEDEEEEEEEEEEEGKEETEGYERNVEEQALYRKSKSRDWSGNFHPRRRTSVHACGRSRSRCVGVGTPCGGRALF
ncbi:hypothetical protein ALC53_01910 [Atta colombica]|uniref:Uncharacterized protein n=1 Tax=Atta colombica TaxID=520822 RepID=A0A195BSG0_9HYME|nr:hypothetical protein ALC53_01910 [Atta colombica]